MLLVVAGLNLVLTFLTKSVRFPLVFLVIIGLFSCTEKISIADDDLGQAYFPAEVGNYWIYDVSETKVQDNHYDSTTYQIRELIDSVFTNQLNELTYRVLKSRRSNSSQPWSNDSLYTININALDVQVIKNNRRTIALIFPVAEGKEWNVNAFNIRDTKEYHYLDVNQPVVIQGKSYNKSIKVIQSQPHPNYLDDQFEVYAYNVGLIYKKFQYYEYAHSQLTGNVDDNDIVIGIKRIFTLNEFCSPE